MSIKITDIANINDGTFVDGPIVGRVSSAKNLQTKTGKDMSVAHFGDDNATVELMSFDQSFLKWDGKVVELSGKGIKKDSYNGKAKLMVGKSVKITPADGTAAPTSGGNPDFKVGKPNAHNGATVGGSVARAFEWITAWNTLVLAGRLDKPIIEPSIENIESAATKILNLCERLERGATEE